MICLSAELRLSHVFLLGQSPIASFQQKGERNEVTLFRVKRSIQGVLFSALASKTSANFCKSQILPSCLISETLLTLPSEDHKHSFSGHLDLQHPNISMHIPYALLSLLGDYFLYSRGPEYRWWYVKDKRDTSYAYGFVGYRFQPSKCRTTEFVWNFEATDMR